MRAASPVSAGHSLRGKDLKHAFAGCVPSQTKLKVLLMLLVFATIVLAIFLLFRTGCQALNRGALGELRYGYAHPRLTRLRYCTEAILGLGAAKEIVATNASSAATMLACCAAQDEGDVCDFVEMRLLLSYCAGRGRTARSVSAALRRVNDHTIFRSATITGAGT